MDRMDLEFFVEQTIEASQSILKAIHDVLSSICFLQGLRSLIRKA